MTQIGVSLGNGRRIAFEVTLGLDGPAYFALSVRKCGSTLFNYLCRHLAHFNGKNFVPVGSTFFWNNILAAEFTDDATLLHLIRPQNVYGEFRDMPSALLASDLFRTGPKLFMIRDLRDALVSEYFSNAFSHPIPEKNSAGDKVTEMMMKQRCLALGEGLDNAIMRRARPMSKTVLQFAPILDLERTTVLKYEDYIYNKRGLIDVIVDRFGWTITDEQAGQLASFVDIRPEKEDPTAFVRHVAPGDYREKLRPETIDKINRKLKPAMELFGYSL